MRVIIAGGGLGGLSLTLSLNAAGIDAVMYEAAPELRSVGLGINVLPHACRELIELGLGERLEQSGIRTEALMYANRHGQEIWREPRGKFAGYNWPQYSIHRGALQMLMYDAVVERMGAGAVQAGQRVARAETIDGGVKVWLRDEQGEPSGTVTGDILVGCDGIHSAVRAQFYPDEGPPKWNQRVLWRGVTLGEQFLGGATMVMAGHQDQKFVCYPIDASIAKTGRSMINWIAELRFPETDVWRREDWNRAGRLEDFLPQFESWHFGWLDVPKIIKGAERVLEYPLVDRDPVARWTFGRATLLGDAAHPMYPIGSNGASQAILDARTLAYHLANEGSVDEALAKYEAVRRPATERLVLLNRGNGPEQVMQLAHERAPNGFSHVHDVLSQAELEATAGEYKKVAGFDRDALNQRPSLNPRVAADARS